MGYYKYQWKVHYVRKDNGEEEISSTLLTKREALSLMAVFSDEVPFVEKVEGVWRRKIANKHFNGGKREVKNMAQQ